MRMYAACLASYNNGDLHGEWFDLEDYSDKDELLEAIAEKVLRTSPYPNVTVECPECDGPVASTPGCDAGDWQCPCCDGSGRVPSAEEWAAHDWDGEGLSGFGEYPDLDEVLTHVRMVSEHGDAWVAYVDHVGAHHATEEDFSDSFAGAYDSPEDWAEEFLTDTGALGSIPESLRYYFNFESYARDARIGGYMAFVEHGGKTYVFHS
ncbi:antirestriction protein ArdA [Pseudomonas guariconensis]|uniref:antirestriction protein ArdA n=1 Tax=Pseudomonas guariconensis TaxID=1288410 RepID=UPI002B05EE50|nr:antirestriction protein ArdA [Pseudomonas guariconensis]